MHNTFSKAPGPAAPATAPGTTTGAPGSGVPGNRTPGGKPPARPGSRTLSMLASASLLLLAGCNQIDPLERPYMWHPNGSNDTNIAAMAVNPSDLVRGRETDQRRVILESDGVSRLWTGHQLPLLSDQPGASTSGSTSTGGGSGTSSGGGS